MLVTSSDGPNATPSPVAEQSSAANPAHSWRPLYLLNIYRLVLSGLFLTVVSLGVGVAVFGNYNRTLFAAVSAVYLCFSVVSWLTIRRRRPGFFIQVYFQVFTDIVLLVLLMHASGSVQSGIGILLIVAIAGGSLLIARKRAVLLAAAATLSMFAEQGYVFLYSDELNTSLTQTGLLGATLFVTATAAQWLARRVRESEELASRRGVDLANMEQLTEYVIERMQTGIIVLDHDNKISLINESAWNLLGMPVAPVSQPLAALSPLLAGALQGWQSDSHNAPGAIKVRGTGGEVMPRFARLGHNRSAGTLIFLEDLAAAAQQAQHMKLASLGRLTASIAHEIRNPLGAISHASQLLGESTAPDDANARLVQIILANTKRLNTVIENVLQLSRRQRAQLEEVDLGERLRAFVEEFRQTQGLAAGAISVQCESSGITVRFDPGQLQQVLWNLCQNGIRYTQPRADGALMELVAGVTGDIAYLDIVDFGPGIAAQHASQIFEPFFTTETKGTGLGLFVARELCECNQARLSYIPGDGRCCFRIHFADKRRLAAVV